MIFDKNNNEVKIGSMIKVLFIDPGFISTFPRREARIIKKMVGKTFEVVDIEHEKALVTQPFDMLNSISLFIDSEEMELINDN